MVQLNKCKIGSVVLLCGLLSMAAAVADAQSALAYRDLGLAPAATPIRRVQLVLRRSAERERALATLMDRQQDPASPDFHRWLTPAEYGAQFGPSDDDLGHVTAWLERQGFHDIRVNNGRTLVEFSGSAGSIQAAFGTSIHAVALASGETRYSSSQTPRVPSDFASSVGGIASLGNVASPPTVHPNWTLASNNTTYYPVTPYDFAAIYNVLPLWNASTPVDGTGQTIAVVGDTDINPADFVAFRTLFSLPLGSTTSQTGTQYLNIIYNGPQPAVLADEYHADSDTQWAAAVAKGATIDYVASEATEASSGEDLSAAYIVDNNLAPILVDSYTSCEATLGSTESGFYKALWQQAAAQGITVVTASGDAGAAACDPIRVAPAALGTAVNGIASTAYDVAVGGTDFYAPNGLSSYFGANSANFASVAGYIPEMVWNDTCTNPEILAQIPYAGLTAEQACNSASAKAAGLAVVVGSGGGASALYAKPTWQSAPGVPADGARDLPDVSLFASQGRNNSFYVVCQQSRNIDGQPCNLGYPYSDFAGYGGTEVAAPAFAGILALAAQKSGARLGNPNYVLYQLATLQSNAGTSCNATSSPASACVFHDITSGTNAMPCLAHTPSCFTANPGDAYGILSAASASVGYDVASGLGSVDAYNLVSAWSKVVFSPTSAILSISPSQVVHGAPVTAKVMVRGTSPTGQVAIDSQAGNGSVGSGPLSNGVFTQSFRNFPGGSYGVQAHYAGDPINAPADSNFVSLTITPEPSSTSLETLAYNPATLTSTAVSSAPYGTVFYIRANVEGQSGQGIATGNVAITDNGTILGSGVYRLNSSGYTEAQNNSIAPGSHSFAAAYSGDASFDASSAPTAALTITRAPTAAAVTATPATVSIGATVTLSAVLSTQSFGYQAPSGTVTFYAGSQVLGTSTLTQGSNPNTYCREATATLTISAAALTIGTDAITVAYGGDLNYLPATSPSASEIVTGTALLPTLTSASAAPATVTPTGSVVFSAAVTPAAKSTLTPAGTVQFEVDGQNLGRPVALSAGLAGVSASASQWTVGPHSVTAVYSGDAVNFRSSVSSAAPFLIATPGITSVPAFTATPMTAVQGTFISVSAGVTPSQPVATGTVQLILDGGPYGSAIPLVSAAATLPLISSTLQTGSHILTVFYSGDSTFASAYAVPVTLVITAPGVTASSVTLSNLPSQMDSGVAAYLTASVTPASPTPTGIFQIILDGGNPGTPILLNGASNLLSIPASSLGLGSHTVKVFYSGDATYNFSTSAAWSFNVVQPVNAPSFTMAPAAQSFSVSRIVATPVAVQYSVTPAYGFTGPVAFTCDGLPSFASCAFSPATVTISGSSAVSTGLTLSINTGISEVAKPPSALWRLPIAFAGGLFGFMLYRRSRRLIPALLAMALTVGLAAGTGCGSGYAHGTTPAGTFTVSVIATGGGVTQKATINLTVN